MLNNAGPGKKLHTGTDADLLDWPEGCEPADVQKYNGCGPAGILGFLIPNKINGVNICLACKIHDFDYDHGRTWEQKAQADKRFLHNMTALILAHNDAVYLKTSWPWLYRQINAARRRDRLEIARAYYLAVKNFGGPFYNGAKK